MIIFLYGKDTFRSKQKLSEFKDKFLREVDKSGNSLKTIQGETLSSLDELNQAVSTTSLFSEKRMVVVENIFNNKSKIFLNEVASFLENRKSDDSIVIFVDENEEAKIKTTKLFKFLKEQKFVQEFKPLSMTETVNWIRERVIEEGASIDAQAINHLNGLFQGDLWAISNEIRKIVHFKKAKQTELIKEGGSVNIVLADVEKFCRGQVDENIFALTDAISQKRKPQAVALLEKEFEAGVAETYLLHMIERQFKILLQVRQALDSGLNQRQIVSELKLHPFVAQKSIGQVRNFSLEFLKRLFSYLVNIDKEIKTGQNDLKTAIGLVIAKI